MSLETKVTKCFIVSLHREVLCFYGHLREEKGIKRMRYVHKIGKKEHIEILLIFRMLFRQ